MSEFVHVAVDAMGGDNAPSEIVKGSVNALNSCPNLKVTFTGKEELVKAELEKLKYPADRVQILNCTEVIAMAEPPVDAIRTKKDSSIVKGLRLVKDGECDAFVTAGSTGAAAAGNSQASGRKEPASSSAPGQYRVSVSDRLIHWCLPARSRYCSPQAFFG